MAAANAWHARRYVVVDTEGNGGRPAELVELALVPIVDGVIGTPRSWLVRPDQPITWQAQQVHGIGNDQVAQAPTIELLYGEIVPLLSDVVIVGHNVRFDIAILTRQLHWSWPRESVDTLRLARNVLPGLHSYRLTSLVDLLELAADAPPGLRPHRAAYDAVVTARLFTKLATRDNGEPRTIAELQALNGFPAAAGEQLDLFD